MSYRVNVENFEGPFDLLLYLVSRQKVDIGAIAITEIIDQYLAEIQSLRELDLDVASDFLLVASTLLKIKAESLLAKPNVELDEDIAYLEPNAARDMLVERLVEYKGFKNAAADLDRRFEREGRMHARPFGPDAKFANAMPDFLRGVSMGDFAGLAAAAFARREAFLLDAEHIAAKPIPVETYVKTIFARIQNRGTMRFSDLVDAATATPIVVVSFLAILELYKRGKIHVRQKKAFGDIELTCIDDSDALDSPDADVPVTVRKGR